MPSPADLHNSEVGANVEETFAGHIAKDIAEVDQLAFVVIPSIDPVHMHGPCRWSPVARADGLYFPKRGDECLIVFPAPMDAGPWVAQFSPEGSVDVPF